MLRSIGTTTVAATLIVAGAPCAAQQTAPSGSGGSAAGLGAKAQATGESLRIIVRLAETPPAAASDADMAHFIRKSGEAVVADVLGAERAVTYMVYTPMFVTHATAEEIARLVADPRVAAVQKDELAKP